MFLGVAVGERGPTGKTGLGRRVRGAPAVGTPVDLKSFEKVLP